MNIGSRQEGRLRADNVIEADYDADNIYDVNKIKDFKKEFLGHLPIHQDLRNSADKGNPLTHSDPDHEVSKLFKKIAEKIKLSFLSIKDNHINNIFKMILEILHDKINFKSKLFFLIYLIPSSTYSAEIPLNTSSILWWMWPLILLIVKCIIFSI